MCGNKKKSTYKTKLFLPLSFCLSVSSLSLSLSVRFIQLYHSHWLPHSPPPPVFSIDTWHLGFSYECIFAASRNSCSSSFIFAAGHVFKYQHFIDPPQFLHLHNVMFKMHSQLHVGNTSRPLSGNILFISKYWLHFLSPHHPSVLIPPLFFPPAANHFKGANIKERSLKNSGESKIDSVCLHCTRSAATLMVFNKIYSYSFPLTPPSLPPPSPIDL